MRRFLVGLLAAPSLVATGAAQAQAQMSVPGPNRTDPDDAMLFDLRVGRLKLTQGAGASTTKAGLCLDLRDVISALELPLKPSADGQSLEGWAFDPAHVIHIDRAAAQARFGQTSEPLRSDTIWQSQAGWCVLAKDLQRWLGVSFDPDMANAILTIKSDKPLPVEAAAARAETADRLNAINGSQDKPPELPLLTMPYRLWRTPALDVSTAIGVRRERSGPAKANGSYEVLAAGELAWFSSDARLVSNENGSLRSFRLKLYRDDAAGRLLGPLRATQMAMGDVVSSSSILASSATAGRGITLSNRPLGAATRTDATDFTGVSPKGWDTELYRNGELIHALPASQSGRYEFRDIALLTGPNEFEIVQYGPQGQVKRERKSYRIAAQMPTKGETWWYGALVQGGMDLFEFRRPTGAAQVDGTWRLDAGVSHGLGKGTSVSASIHSLERRGEGRLLIGEAEATTTLRGIVANLALARDRRDGMAYRAKAMAQALGTNISIETLQNRGLVSERLDASLRSTTQVSADRTQMVGKLVMPIHFDLRSTLSNGERTRSAETRLSLIGRRVTVTAGLSVEQRRSANGLTLNEVLGRMLFNARVGKVRLRGESQWKIGPVLALDNASANADFSLGKNVVNMGIGYARSDHVFYAGANVSRDVRIATFTAGAQFDTRRAFTLSASLQFSMGPNGRGRFGPPQSAPRAAAGAIEVAVFRDGNGNGVRDAGEALMPSPGLLLDDTVVAAKDKKVQKDGGSSQTVGSLAPAMPVRLLLDESGIQNSFDISSSKGFTVVPRAGIVTRVALGITSTATIEGRVVANGRDASGVALELVDDAGNPVRQFRTDFDGFFSLERIPYGRYHLRQVGAGPQGMDIVVTTNERQPTIRLGKIEIAPSVRINTQKP